MNHFILFSSFRHCRFEAGLVHRLGNKLVVEGDLRGCSPRRRLDVVEAEVVVIGRVIVPFGRIRQRLGSNWGPIGPAGELSEIRHQSQELNGAFQRNLSRMMNRRRKPNERREISMQRTMRRRRGRTIRTYSKLLEHQE